MVENAVEHVAGVKSSLSSCFGNSSDGDNGAYVVYGFHFRRNQFLNLGIKLGINTTSFVEEIRPFLG